MNALAEIIDYERQLTNLAGFYRVIKTEEEYHQALDLFEQLEEFDDELEITMEILAKAISEWEDRLPEVVEWDKKVDELDPALTMLKVIMDQRNLKSKDLMDVLGTEGYISMILKGSRKLTRTHIEKLAKKFDISPRLFYPF